MARGPARAQERDRDTSSDEASDASEAPDAEMLAQNRRRRDERDYDKDVALVAKTSEKQLDALRKQWAQVAKNLSEYTLTLAETAEVVAQSYDPPQNHQEEWDEVMKEMDQVMRHVCDRHYEAIVRERAIQDLRQQLIAEDKLEDCQKLYEAAVIAKMDQYEGKGPRRRYGKNRLYERFRSKIWDTHHPDTHMPSLKQMIAEEAEDNESSDDEVERGAVKRDFLDPLTKTMIRDPVRSSKCQHVYDANTIREHIGNKPSIGCPYAGCNALLALADLKPDPEYKKTLLRAKRAAANETHQATQGTGGASQRRRQVVVEDSDDDDE